MVNGLPEKLKELRTKANLSQREAARQLQISPSIISAYETGDRTPSAENLLALSFLYRCSTDYLLGKESSSQDVLNTEGLTPRQIRLLADLIDTMR